MPIFAFTGRNASGSLISGRRLSQSADGLGAQLIREGVIPVSITPVEHDEDQWTQIKDWIRGRRVSLEELGIFARQMYTLNKAGVPLTSALRQLADNARSIHMANALHGLVESLESGQNLANGMQEYPSIFTPLMVSMVRVGENSGKLDESFLHLNQYLEMESTTIKRLKTALRYPVFIIFAIIFAVVIINIFVIPTFAKVFAQSNVALPKMTRVLITFSTFLIHYWYVLLISIILIVAMVVYYLHTPAGRLAWDRTKLRIPIIGIVIKRIILLRFSQSFSLVVSSGVPIIEGLGLVSQTLENEYARQEILSIQQSVQHGKSLTQAVGATDMFTPLELQMLAVSEETGELSTMLDHLGVFYRREVDYDLKKLSDVIEPVLMICLALIVLMLAFSVYLPIWNMVKIVH